MKSRKYLIILVTAAMCIAAVISCNHQGPAEVTPVVSFTGNIQPILTASCAISTDCHVGSTSTNDHIDLTDSLAYSTITSKSLVNTANPTSSLLYVEVSTGLMPKDPYAKLTQAQIDLILNWIKQGAKNN